MLITPFVINHFSSSQSFFELELRLNKEVLRVNLGRNRLLVLHLNIIKLLDFAAQLALLLQVL